MRLSDLSIDRPVLATVMSLLIVVAGVGSWFALPIREYPDVDAPLVSVTTIYAGASPETVEATITEPLEQEMNGIEAIRAVQSTSGFGESSITVEFEAGRDIDLAATDVSNAVQRAVGDLPAGAERPVVRKSGANTFPFLWLQLKGEGFSPVELTDFADRLVKTKLQLLPGVARAMVGGARRYAMRVWLDPAAMAQRGVDALDVRQALVESNLQLPAGEIEAVARKYTVNANAQLDEAREFERIVIREVDDVPIRVGDVARVELGSENYHSITRFDAEPIVGIGVIRQSRANQLEVARRVLDALPEIRTALPEGVELEVATDETVFVQASLTEVGKTLAIAFAVVVAVNIFFLRSRTTTAITSVSIPISLVGTFAVMQVLGFSVNLLTLLALVLAIGLLVDDAIVVLENVYRRQELGEPRMRAARNGAREVGFPVIATSLAVVAVLLPLSLMGGGTGRLFREFAISLAGAVAISTFVALTLVPMLCSRFLVAKERRGRINRGIERSLDAARDGFDRGLGWALAHRPVVGLLLLAVVAAAGALFWALPSTFVPVEDRGTIIVMIRAPEGSTAAFTDRALRQVEAELSALDAVEGFFESIGMAFGQPPSTSVGTVFVRLRPWGRRDTKQQAIAAGLFPRFMAIPEALVFAVNPPSLAQGGFSDIEVVLKSSGASFEELGAASDAVMAGARKIPGIVNLDSDLRLDAQQLEVIFDRERAADLGVPIRSVVEALRLLVSQSPTDEFVLRNRQYDVITALAGRLRSEPEQLGQIHVRGRDGAMVPLSGLIRVVRRTAPASIDHYDLERSATITGNLAPGASLGEVLDRLLAVVEAENPPGFTAALGGISREYREASGEVYLTFAIAIVVIYLVLAAQFESFVHPVTILLSVPLAALGALLALYLSDNSINLYTQIGFVLLVGLVTKNSILLVDFANQARARGLPLLEALREAGHVRFRPILMTSTTSVLSAMPLALATGAGEESRAPIGIAIVGGLLFSTIFTLLVIPVVHHAVTRLAERIGLQTIPPLVALPDGEDEPRA